MKKLTLLVLMIVVFGTFFVKNSEASSSSFAYNEEINKVYRPNINNVNEFGTRIRFGKMPTEKGTHWELELIVNKTPVRYNLDEIDWELVMWESTSWSGQYIYKLVLVKNDVRDVVVEGTFDHPYKKGIIYRYADFKTPGKCAMHLWDDGSISYGTTIGKEFRYVNQNIELGTMIRFDGLPLGSYFHWEILVYRGEDVIKTFTSISESPRLTLWDSEWPDDEYRYEMYYVEHGKRCLFTSDTFSHPDPIPDSKKSEIPSGESNASANANVQTIFD